MNNTLLRVLDVVRPSGAARLRVVLTAALLIGTPALNACEGDTARKPDIAGGSPEVTTTAALPAVTGETAIYIDSVNKQVPSAKGPVVVNIEQTPQIMVNGWAVDKPAQSPAGGVVMVIDGKTEVPTTYGAERADVAKFLNNPNYAKSSFVGWINVSIITKGQHILSFRVLTADKRGYYEPANKITLALQ
jgi:hypothetical protein